MTGFGFTRLALTWRELVTRTIKEFVADNGLGLAAQLAYYFFSLFPAILVGIALASFFPLENFLDRTTAEVDPRSGVRRRRHTVGMHVASSNVKNGGYGS